MCSKIWTSKSTGNCSDSIKKLIEALQTADAVLIGAGSGLSAAAGFTYSGKRFRQYFSDFMEKYGIRDMYSGGFYPFSGLEEYWGWWARHIYVNRYMDVDDTLYADLLTLVRKKDYFVLTTNVDHQFQKAGFDKTRLFYTQGDYGLWQCKSACHRQTYDNENTVIQMLLSSDFLEEKNGTYLVTNPSRWKTEVDPGLVPYCPHCGEPMTMNLRCDDSFVQDDGWEAAGTRYSNFVRKHQSGPVLYLELGVGANTPAIIKYPFWHMTAENPEAVYACLNYGEAFAPEQISHRSICLNEDIKKVLKYFPSH